jgi:serine/threonine protein kinase
VDYFEYGQDIQSEDKPDLNAKNYIALEFAENGNLIDYFDYKKACISEKWLRFWFKQVLSGLQYI